MDFSNQNAQYYFDAWKVTLASFLGWSESETAAWATQFRPRMEQNDWTFYHEDPLWYVIPLLLPKDWFESVPETQKPLVTSRFAKAVRGNDANPWSNVHFDWVAARARFEAEFDGLRREFA